MALLAQRLAKRSNGNVPVNGAGFDLRGDDAAFVNGSAGTVLELDEGSQFARGHPACMFSLQLYPPHLSTIDRAQIC